MGQRNYIATLEVGAYKTTLAVQIQQADGHWVSRRFVVRSLSRWALM